MPRYSEAEYQIYIAGNRSSISEAVWQGMVIEAATQAGWLHYHTHDSRKSQRGFPDLVLVRPPDILFIELKTETGVMQPDQKVWQQWLSQCPQIEYAIWRPSDFTQIAQRLGKRRQA